MDGRTRIRIGRAAQRQHEPEKLPGSECVRTRAIHAGARDLSRGGYLGCKEGSCLKSGARSSMRQSKEAKHVANDPIPLNGGVPTRTPPYFSLLDLDLDRFGFRCGAFWQMNRQYAGMKLSPDLCCVRIFGHCERALKPTEEAFK